MSQAPIELTYLERSLESDETGLVEAFAAVESHAESVPACETCAAIPPPLAELGHELRAAVLAIVGYCEMLADSPRDTERDTERLAGIRANGHHLLDLLNSLPDGQQTKHSMAIIEPAPCSPWEIVQEVVASYLPQARQKGLELQVTPGHDLPESVLTDGLRLKRILNNLVSNAVKYSETGAIRVDVGLESRSRGGKPLDPVLRIEVCDQGVGIDAEEIKHLAQPFYRGRFAHQRQIEGTGLGLTITRQLVEQLGGQLGVASEGGRGTLFRLRLPVDIADQEPTAPPEASQTEALPASSEVTLRGCVLLVEDNPHHRAIIGEHLRQAGLQVEMADRGDAALAADLQRFDAIILDQHLPRLSGRATAEAMRAQGYRGPILSLTADRRIPLQTQDEPFTYALSKASDREEIIERLAHLLPRREAEAVEPSAAPTRLSSSESLPREARFQKLLGRYIKNLDTIAKEIRQALQAQKYLALRSLAHRMMGSAGLYGFPQLTEAAGRLYQATEQAGCEGVSEQDTLLEQRVQQIENCVASIARDHDGAAQQALRRALPR